MKKQNLSEKYVDQKTYLMNNTYCSIWFQLN